MTTAERNFICNRKMKILNSAKFAFFVLSLLVGLVFPWINSTLWEKIIFGCLLWIDLFVVLLYASESRMKNQRHKNAFYGWQMYFLSWLLLYCTYRVVFNHYHWLLWIYIGYGIVQSLLWFFGVVYNIYNNKYCNNFSGKSTFNIFTGISIIIGVAVLITVCFMMSWLGYSGITCGIAVCFFFVHYSLLVSITFLVQWVLMVKYNIKNSEEIMQQPGNE